MVSLCPQPGSNEIDAGVLLTSSFPFTHSRAPVPGMETQTGSRVCFLGDSKSNHGDLEDETAQPLSAVKKVH